jgi:hypothetical protein
MRFLLRWAEALGRSLTKKKALPKVMLLKALTIVVGATQTKFAILSPLVKGDWSKN